MYCSVILRGSVRQTDILFTYRVPESLKSEVFKGSLVSVPLGKGDSQRCAVVTEISDSFDGDPNKVKDISSVISSMPVLKPDQLALIDKISDRFNCTRGDVVELMVPSCVVNHKNPVEVFAELVSEQTAKEVLESETLRSAAHINILEVCTTSTFKMCLAQSVTSKTTIAEVKIFQCRTIFKSAIIKCGIVCCN